MNIWSTLITNSQPAELVKPSESAFDNPAVNTQTAAVLRATLGQHRSNPKLAQRLTVGLRVVSTITLNTVRTLTRPTTLTGNRRNSFNQWQKLCNIMTIGTGDFHRQRDAACICNQMVFAARFASISGIWAGFRPPKTARTDAESATAREKSSMSACRNLFSSRPCILSHTPAFCQSLSRRQQVIPLPQPISFGRCSQGMPVLRTNRIPVKVARSEIGFRPGYRNLLLFFGISGSMSFHNSSSNIGFAMSNLLVTGFRLLMLSVIPVNILSFC